MMGIDKSLFAKKIWIVTNQMQVSPGNKLLVGGVRSWSPPVQLLPSSLRNNVNFSASCHLVFNLFFRGEESTRRQSSATS
jgi:hypothetical protein